MDTMDIKSKMVPAILIATAGALVGACVAFFMTRHQRKRKSSQSSDGQQDSLLDLRSELDDCRKTLEDFRLRLEQETERRNESEAWNRKLEQDLVDLAAARKNAEEKCADLCRELDIAKGKLKFSETERKGLKSQVQNLQRKTDTMPSVALADVIYGQKPKVPTKNMRSPEKAPVTKADDKSISFPAKSLFTDAPVSRVEDVLPDSVEEEIIVECGPDGRPINSFENFEESFEDEDDYSDEGEDGECDDSDISIIKTNILDQTDDNFELGQDVMGALIANAFKDGVIESREGDDVSLSEESHDQHVTTSEAGQVNQTSDTEKGVVSQESIGDIKTTRRFWEQMIAADKPSDDDDYTDDDDDITDDDDDIIDDYDDVTDEEDNIIDRLQSQKDSMSNSQGHLGEHHTQHEGQLSQTQETSASVIPNGNRVAVNGRRNEES